MATRADTDPMASAPSVRVRRRVVVAMLGGVVCLGAMTIGPLVSAQSASSPVSLDSAGTALVPAERLSLRPSPVPEGMLMFPLLPGAYCNVNNDFGAPRGSTRSHEGVDIMSTAAQPVYAVVTGTLTKRYTNTGSAGWGWTLQDDTTGTNYKYFHLAGDANGLEVGARVRAGDVIGYVGASGTSAPDSNFHLHFEVWPGTTPIDPVPLLHIDPKRCRVTARS